MNVIETKIPELLIFEPRVFADERGWFMESFNQNVFEKALKERGFDVQPLYKITIPCHQKVCCVDCIIKVNLMPKEN